jgi:hypothetical protein
MKINTYHAYWCDPHDVHGNCQLDVDPPAHGSEAVQHTFPATSEIPITEGICSRLPVRLCWHKSQPWFSPCFELSFWQYNPGTGLASTAIPGTTAAVEFPLRMVLDV